MNKHDIDYKLLRKIYYQKSQSEYKQICNERKTSYSTILLPLYIHDNQSFFVVTNEILLIQEKIYKGNIELNNITDKLSTLGNEFCSKSCLIDEIYSTNDIEGIYSTRKELNELYDSIISKEKYNTKERFRGMMRRYISFKNQNKEIHLKDSKDIRHIYDKIILPEVEQANKENIPDGKIFRKGPVEVVTVTDKICHTGIIGEQNIIKYIDDLLKLLDNSNITSLIKIAIIHYFIGYIHPFYDGNGRLSRFISSYLLGKNLNHFISYRLSYTISENKSLYYSAFDESNDIKNFGDITYFITVFLKIISESISSLNSKLSEILQHLEYYKQFIKIHFNSSNEYINNMIDIFLENSMFDADGLSTDDCHFIFDKSVPTISKYIKQIIEMGFPLKYIRYGNKKIYTIDREKLDNMIIAE